MDLLAGYGDDDGSDEDQQMPAVPQQQLKQQQQQQPAPAAVKLPNPFADEPSTSGSTQPATKRPHGQVTGHVLSQAKASTSQQNKAAKQPSKASPGQGQSAAGGPFAMVPPQLRGRSNVVTEDLDKLFTRRPSQPQTNKQQTPGSGGSTNKQ